MQSRLPLVFTVTALCTLTGMREVYAFCRTTTCDTCVQPVDGCIQEGKPLYWADRCVSYDVQREASTQVPYNTASAIAGRAFAHWTAVSCPGSNGPPSIAFLDLGPVTCESVEYNDPNSAQAPRAGGNANIVMFRDTDWARSNAADPTSTLALTTVTFSRASGEIFDADVEVNGNKGLSITDPVSPTAYDLESILTHEAGHFLGLAHSRQGCSGFDCPTMTASYVKASAEFRTLEDDDIAGVCAIYPTDRPTAPTDCRPKHGFGDACGVPVPPRTGCSVAHATPTTANPEGARSLGTWFAAAVAFLVVRRPRRRAD